jgi:PAS domain S-box-containing protein
MIESAKPNNGVPLEVLIRNDAVPLESILCTEELRRRPSRPPDYKKENRALVTLASALVDSQPNILQTLAETILDVTQCDSSGISLLTNDGRRFYWPAIAGRWTPHIGGGTPRNFGPCGDVLDHNSTLLFRHFERRYTYFVPVTPLIEECLLVPFYVRGKAVGTIWAIMHDDCRKFDAEDERLMSVLGQFASLAYQTLASINDLKFQIAEREKAETALHELASGLEAKIRRLVDANIIGIVFWNVEGRIIEANEAFLRMVGYGREDLVSGRLSWREITPDKWREADEQALAELAATGVCEPFEKECSRKDGSHVPVLVGAAFLEGSRDEGVAFVLDLTERKLAEETVRKTLAELAHVARVTTMGELVTSIAHEVNQPLAAIATNAQVCLRWLTRDVPNLEEVRKAAELIARDGKRASDVISRIRALVRKTGSEKEQLNIDRAIEEVVHLMEEEALRKGVVLRTELAGDLPFVLADRVQLQQVLLNLIINGVEAMSSVADGRRELLVYSCLHESKQVLVGVQDFGFGIEPENLKKIFDPFYTTKSQGMGMGLAISRSIVENHGGKLWASPNDGPGATFKFTLLAHEKTSGAQLNYGHISTTTDDY